MQRSAPYRPFIEKLLRDAHLPVELLFLPVVESGFLERAVSKSGAVGIWQFMRNSIAGSAMRVSDWVDERRDPWKASVAAVKKLQWNYTQLRDWPL
ncbi:transglycosylase SLT domain-containing protein, partial [Treponema pallidum subsp. pallidum]